MSRVCRGLECMIHIIYICMCCAHIHVCRVHMCLMYVSVVVSVVVSVSVVRVVRVYLYVMNV
mgnify:CR=1 FL=1